MQWCVLGLQHSVLRYFQHHILLQQQCKSESKTRYLSLDTFCFYFVTADFFSLWLAGMLSECLLKVHCCGETVFLMGRTENSNLFCAEEWEMNSGATGNAKQGTVRHPTVSLILLVPSADGSFCSLRGFCFFWVPLHHEGAMKKCNTIPLRGLGLIKDCRE